MAGAGTTNVPCQSDTACPATLHADKSLEAGCLYAKQNGFVKADGADLMADPPWEAQFQLIQAGTRALSAIEFRHFDLRLAISS
jgi:hypothetical protein